MDAVLYDWPFVALGGGIVGFVVLLVVQWPSPRWRDPAWLVCLMLPVYLLHQFEEHGFDLLGRRYQFIVEMCKLLGYAELAACPADRAFILAVNAGGVWLPGVLAILFRSRNPMIGACAWGVPLVNVVAHVLPAIARGAYNPGLFTAAALFLPLGVYVMRTLRRDGILDGRRLAMVIAGGVALHLVLIGGFFAFAHGLISHAANLAIQMANGFVPLLFAALARRAR